MDTMKLTHVPSSIAGTFPEVTAAQSFATEATGSSIEIPCLEVDASTGLGKVTMGAPKECHVELADFVKANA